MITHRIRPRIPRIHMQHLMPNPSIRDDMRRQIHMIERLLRILKRIRVPFPRWRVGHVVDVGHARLRGEGG